MKKLILVLILTTSVIFCFERKNRAFTYAAIGVDLILPAFCIGSRQWSADSGFDINASVSSIVIINRVSVNVSYLKRFINNQYIGIGGGSFLVIVPFNDLCFVNCGVFPSLKFGKEYENTFHEVGIAMPQLSKYGMVFFPVVSYRYGF